MVQGVVGGEFLLATAITLVVPVVTKTRTLGADCFLSGSFGEDGLGPTFTPGSNCVLVPTIKGFGTKMCAGFRTRAFLCPVSNRLGAFLGGGIDLRRFREGLPHGPRVSVTASLGVVGFKFVGKGDF